MKTISAVRSKPILGLLLLVCLGAAPALAALTPLSVSANHRYLQDGAGKPFFLVGDCPQNLPLKLALSELEPYMADCERKGFNLLWICIDGQRGYSPKPQPPIDRQHQPMMKNGWDIGTLNEAYFATIDATLDAAERHGIYCMLTPLSECQWAQAEIKRNTPDKWLAYGFFLGTRYQKRNNILWQIGNDHINEDAQHAIVRGIQEAGDRHLMSVNWIPGSHKLGSSWVRKHQFGEGWIDLDAWYENAPTSESGMACYWQKIEYQREDPMPSFLTEGPYQLPDRKNASDLDIRKLNFYVALGGGCGGHVYGAGWLADEWDYAKYRDNGGRVQTIHFKNLFVTRDWTSLVPDYDHAFITAGYGTLTPNTPDYVGAAMNSGTLGLAYCPQAATITANLAKFTGPITARWYDPTSGNYRSITGSPFAPSGSRDFTTPGANAAGSGDWVLVMEK